jgi:hypothetical protein
VSRNKRRTIEKILKKSQVPESLKISFLRAYDAAHRNKKISSKPGGDL